MKHDVCPWSRACGHGGSIHFGQFSISAFRGPGDRRTKNHRLQPNREITNSEIPKSGPWSRVDFDISGNSGIQTPGIGKTENRGNACIMVSRIAKAR
jgi:hypothetical protein